MRAYHIGYDLTVMDQAERRREREHDRWTRQCVRLGQPRRRLQVTKAGAWAPPGVVRAGALLMVLFMLSLGLAQATGSAAGRVLHPLRTGGNVLVEPYVSATLWFYTLDPAQTTSLPDEDAIIKIYSGLVKQVYDDRTQQFTVVPELAAGLPRVSTSGLVYTFALRADARFSDGTPVTAQDVVYSINRALSPAEKSNSSAFFLADILGAADVAAGKTKTCAGLKAIDQRTVQITLDRPVRSFLYALSFPASYVVKPTLPPAAGVTTRPALVVGAGPFMLKGGTWQYRHQLTLVPNPYYYNARHIKLTEIDLPFVASEEAAFAAYRSGQYPLAQIPAAEVARYRGQPGFHEIASLFDSYLTMNTTLSPLSNRHVRRAVAFAINRDALAYGVEHGTAQPLYSWYPKGIRGYDPAITNQVPHYDPAMARHELALATHALGRVPAGLQLTYSSDAGDQARLAEQIQRDLRAVGISIRLHAMADAAFTPQGNHKLAMIEAGWYADYPDPRDYSEGPLGTGGGWNWGNYSNPRVDALFAKAAVERDPATRERLYKQAQLIILNDAPVAMLFQNATQIMMSPTYHGLELSPSWINYPQPLHNDWANVSVGP